jgi:hypothetical protein
VVDAILDDLFWNGQTVLFEDLIQPRRDTPRAKVASPALKALSAQVRQTTLLDDDYVEGSMETLGFPEKMDGEEGTGRSTADDGNAVIVPQAH